jgi:uncharacterized protein YggE
MKHRIVLAALALSFVALGTRTPADAQTAPAGAPAQTLTVNGQGSITQAPDRATVSFRIETTNDQAAAATSANSALSNALGARLGSLNIPASAISTTGYGLGYTPRPPKPDPTSTQRYGYTVERTIDVVVDNVNNAGAVVDAGVAAGVSNVNGITFSLRDQRAALRGAQAAAVADAVAQAQALAAAAHVRLLRILAIAPAGGASPAPVFRAMAMAEPAVPTSIEPTGLTVSAGVTLRYEIAPATP